MRADNPGGNGAPNPTLQRNISPDEVSGATAEVMRGITIPTRPAVLIELHEKMLSPDASIKDISRIVGSDVGLAGAVLKTANSPWFGLKSKSNSVNGAVSLLGMTNVSSICTQIMLRASLEGAQDVSLERFWDSATDIATISRGLVDRMGEAYGDDAYTLGLFHDCGIPLLMRKFTDYREVLKIANDSKYKTCAQVEDERYGTNHATVGYFVCKSWYLPHDICEAVLNHHNPEIWGKDANLKHKIKSMIGVVQMAEDISHAFRAGQIHLNHLQRHDQTYYEWKNIKLDVFEHFSLSENAYHELHADMMEQLQENA